MLVPEWCAFIIGRPLVVIPDTEEAFTDLASIEKFEFKSLRNKPYLASKQKWALEELRKMRFSPERYVPPKSIHEFKLYVVNSIDRKKELILAKVERSRSSVEPMNMDQ
jgi:hypothetical protein